MTGLHGFRTELTTPSAKAAERIATPIRKFFKIRYSPVLGCTVSSFLGAGAVILWVLTDFLFIGRAIIPMLWKSVAFIIDFEL